VTGNSRDNLASFPAEAVGERRLLARFFSAACRKALEGFAVQVFATAGVSSAGCRRLQAGSLCSPDFRGTAPQDIRHSIFFRGSCRRHFGRELSVGSRPSAVKIEKLY
jgi:hypothetical protein